MGDDKAVLTEHVAALDALINDMRTNREDQKRISLANGKRVGLSGKGWSYVFAAPLDKPVQDDVEVVLEISSSRYACELISASPSQLELILDVDCGTRIPNAILRVDQTNSLVVLKERLNSILKGELAFFNRSLAESVSRNQDVHTFESNIDASVMEDLNKDQQEAIRVASRNSVAFIWGPPGTGKTATLSAFSKSLLNSPLRLLICSTTHRAVDQVFLKLCNTLGFEHPAIQESRIIRTGTIQLQDLRENWASAITPKGICDRRAAPLRTTKEKLELRRNQAQEEVSKLNATLQDFDKAESLGLELAQSRKKIERAAAYCEQVRHERDSVAFRLRQVFEELRRTENTVGFLRWLRRPRLEIENDLTTIRGSLATAESRVSDADRQHHKLQIVIADQQRRLNALYSRLQSSNRIQTRQKHAELSEQIAQLSGHIGELTKEIESLDALQLLRSAKIVGATVTKVYYSPKEFTNFDVIVIDEASMVLQPALYFVAGLAGKKVVISGDFRQLPPIVNSKSPAIRKKLGTDIFQQSGVAEALAGPNQGVANAVMLRTQYRMTDPICQLISMRMYAGKLKTATDRVAREFIGLPLVNGPYHILDTSSVRPFQQRDQTNFLHAAGITQLVKRLADAGTATQKSKAGICSPFRAQAELIIDSLKRAGLDKVSQVGTVHTFQGDESEVVILDTRDGSNRRVPSQWFCASNAEDDGARLLNVAISRARECLVIVANLEYFDSNLPTASMLAGILQDVRRTGTVIDIRDFLDTGLLSEPAFQDLSGSDSARPSLFNSGGFSAHFMSDLEQSRSEIIIYSSFITPERVSQYLDVFRRKQGRVRIHCTIRPPSQNGSISIERGETAIRDLEAVGCFTTRRPNMHEKVAIIDKRVVWCGSLNPLSHTDKTSEIMMRYDDPNLASDVKKFLDANSHGAASGL